MSNVDTSNTASRREFTLKLLVPYVAVGISWNILHSGWLAIAAYHALIIIFQHRDRANPRKYHWQPAKIALLAIPVLAAGPLLYFMLPHITSIDLATWFNAYGIPGWSIAIMIPYFGIIHPIIEQIHWAPLRGRSPISHLVFAGYHMMVLCSVLPPIWLVVAFVVLSAASVAWHWMMRSSGSLLSATLCHIFADLGFVLAAWLSI